MSVSDVVDLAELQRGAPEVLSRCRWSDPVRWVHVGDVADLSGLLQGGELVLTTGASLANAPETYLGGLSRSGALGVIAELGASLPSVPAAVTRLAERENLALVVLHKTVRFVDITEAVHRHVVAEQYDAVAFDRLVHETFTELSMQRASITGIVEAASQMLDESVILEDLAHQVLAASTTSRSRVANVLVDWERRSRLSPGEKIGAENWTVTTVGPRGATWGRLIVPHPPMQPARARMVLERAAVALALHRMIERDRTGLHQKAQSGLIDDVFEHRITVESEVAARAHALGLARAVRYVPLAVRAAHTVSESDPVATQRRNVEQLDAVSHVIRSAGHTGLFAIRRDSEVGALIALNAAKAPDMDRELLSIGRSIRIATSRIAGLTDCVVAVGEPDSRLVDTIFNLAQAAHVAEVAGAMDQPRRPYYRAADVRLRGLIALLKDDPRVQAFAETELRALISGASSEDALQLDVLRAYFASNGNKAALAQNLHISRPALYKRLQAIEHALGVDFADAESVLSLHVALLIHDARSRVAGSRARG